MENQWTLCPIANRPLQTRRPNISDFTPSLKEVALLLKFAHRSNLDGTMDSICRRCIATVATVYDEFELLRYEQQHICDPVLVERFSGLKLPSSELVEEFQDR